MYDWFANAKYYLERGRCPRCNGARMLEQGKRKCSVCLEAQRQYKRTQQERWRAEGKCVRCGGPRDDERYVTCTKCLDKRKIGKAEWARALYDARKDEGKCTQCGVRWAEAGMTMCRQCLNAQMAREKRSDPNGDRRRARRQARIEAGLCIDCGRPTQDGRQRCRRCIDMRMDSTRKYRIRKKMEREARKRGSIQNGV